MWSLTNCFYLYIGNKNFYGDPLLLWRKSIPLFHNFCEVNWIDALSRPLYKDIVVDSLKYCQREKGLIIWKCNTGTCVFKARCTNYFSQGKDMAGIKKAVSSHVLRHSFAMNLLQKGIDMIFIKDLLQDFNIKTSQRDLNVRKEHLVNIISHLKKGGITL